QKVREAANRLKCQNNLKQIGLALHAYHDSYAVLPPGGNGSGNQLGFHVFILPYIEQSSLYNDPTMFDFTQTWAMAPPTPFDRALQVRVPLWYCPSFPEEQGVHSFRTSVVVNTVHYHGVMGAKGPGYSFDGASTPPTRGGFANNGVLYRDSKVRLTDIPDGSSNTFMVGEIAWAPERIPDGGYTHHRRGWIQGTDGTGVANTAHACKNINFGINVR